MTKIGIIGYGYVGKAFARMFDNQSRDKYEVRVYDPFIEKTESELHVLTDEDGINECDLAVICVPTESNDDGSANTSIVEETAKWLETGLILIKSTVPPGTTDKLAEFYPEQHFAMSPEYIGEGKYYVTPRMDFQTDMKKCPFVIIGGSDIATTAILDILVPILGPEKDYFKCTSSEAELIKYMENTYFAFKITFAQEMYEMCQAMGLDWYKVWQGWAKDPRVDVMHTAVFPNARGFSGKCLPKDTNALVKASMEHGYRPDFLIEMLRSNARFRPDEPVRAKDI